MRKRNLAIAIGGAIGVAAAVKLLTRVAGVSWDDAASLIPHSERSRFAEIDGARVHYQEFGEPGDRTLVLVHGYTASTYVWKTAAPMLADEGYHVIAVDLLGFGFSDKPRTFDYSIRSQAAMVSGLIEHLGIIPATLVGSSYGGAVSLTIALERPEQVEKLVLVDAVINDEPKNHPILRLVRYRGVGELLTPFLADSKFFLKKRMHGTLAVANHHLITKDRIDAIRRPLCSREGHHSLLATSRAWSANHIEENLDQINVPTLIIWGEQDKVIPIKHGETLHEKLPDSRFIVLKDCGHVPPEERSDLFVELVANFCRKGDHR